MAFDQLRSQFCLMMWRNSIIKRRKVGEVVKGWLLPVLVFLVLYLLYLDFPRMLATAKTVEETVRRFEDDAKYSGDQDAVDDDLFGRGKEDDSLYMKVEKEVLDVSLNSYLEQVGGSGSRE